MGRYNVVYYPVGECEKRQVIDTHECVTEAIHEAQCPPRIELPHTGNPHEVWWIVAVTVDADEYGNSFSEPPTIWRQAVPQSRLQC